MPIKRDRIFEFMAALRRITNLPDHQLERGGFREIFFDTVEKHTNYIRGDLNSAIVKDVSTMTSRYRRAAKECYCDSGEGDIEIDDEAAVSMVPISEGGGAFVAAWGWVCRLEE